MSAILSCRSCGSDSLQRVLDLGRTPLANRLTAVESAAISEPTYPLQLVYCTACHLLQITETVPPEVLFADYLYFSSFSDAMVAHARRLAENLIAERKLGPDSLVVEAASNDGYLLQHYGARGIPVLGVEPAANVAEVAMRERGVRTVVDFFGRECAGRLATEGHTADVFHAHNVLAHVADLNGFVAGIRTILKPTGVAVIEAPYAKPFVDHREFDTIYHEHLCYFSLTALDALFRRNGLTVRRVEEVAIHGGTLRSVVSRSESAHATEPSVAAMLARETESGMNRFDYYRRFGSEVERLKEVLVGLLRDLKSAGKRIAAYGASAKGSTLLNYFGIGRELLDFVVDRSTVKQGLYTPGTRLPILPPEALLERKPEYVLLLTWNFADEILAQQSLYRERGGRFIVPIPDARVI